MGKAKRVLGVFLSLACVSLVCCLLIGMGNAVDNEQYFEREGSVPEETIIIPTVEDIRVNGYPRNERGETYGPDDRELDFEPDLILVNNGNLYGYIRKNEFNDDGISSPEEALKKENVERVLNVYLQDGVTKIGTFTINGGK